MRQRDNTRFSKSLKKYLNLFHLAKFKKTEFFKDQRRKTKVIFGLTTD